MLIAVNGAAGENALADTARHPQAVKDETEDGTQLGLDSRHVVVYLPPLNHTLHQRPDSRSTKTSS